MVVPMTVEQNIQELQRRVAFLDGWREGEAARYQRLETDVVAIKDELKFIHVRIDQLDHRFNNHRIDELQQNMNARFDGMDKRFESIDRRFETLIRASKASMGALPIKVTA